MKTKVVILGETAEPKKDLKPIEFLYRWDASNTVQEALTSASPANWQNIELISKNYTNELDLMFAYDTCRSAGMAYLGRFNDGVAE